MQLYFTFITSFFSNLLFGQLEQKYDLSSKNLPYWVTLMYDEKSDVGNVIQEYEKFYRENEFKKNKYTQYYKLWLRDLSRTSNPNLENIINNENYSFKIFDSFGKRILSKQNLSRGTKVDLTAHKKGIYQIIFESNDKLRNFKLVNL